MIDEVGLKLKSEDTRYINKNTPKAQECGQTTWFPIVPLLGLRTRGGGGGSQPGGAYNQAFNLGSSQTQGGGAQSFLT